MLIAILFMQQAIKGIVQVRCSLTATVCCTSMPTCRILVHHVQARDIRYYGVLSWQRPLVLVYT